MRVDAVRNHNVILEVAGDLLCQHGPSVSMDAIATAPASARAPCSARFGDRDGLIQAVASERTQVWWQARRLGADESVPARERALRLVDEMFELIVLRLRPLMAAWRSPTAPGRRPGWTAGALIAEVRPEADAAFLAKVIIGACAPRWWSRAASTHSG